jgi:hypothetical protein
MTDSFMPLMRALVAAALLLATATLMLVAVNTARAAGALAIGKCGAFGESYDFLTTEAARKNALTRCAGNTLPRGGQRPARLCRLGNRLHQPMRAAQLG